MKLLFIDDDYSSIEPLIEIIGNKPEKEICHIKEFGKAREKIKSFRPDIVILDIFYGDPSNDRGTGLKSLDFIWANRFRPVIVYSAADEETMEEKITDEHKRHPFIYCFRKGQKDIKNVEESLIKIKPHVDILRSVEEYLDEAFSSVMKELVPYTFGAGENQQQSDIVKRAVRRRLAARMDELSSEDEKLTPWEQYVFPPISKKTIRMGDVIKEKTADGTTPDAFRIVLSPSCDLANSKVENVLVGRCRSVGETLINAGFAKNTKWDKIKKSFLTQGHSNGIVPLPKLTDLIPLMAANLRTLELVPVKKIAENYERVASLDSPFREMVSWAYMQIAGRPGLPERDLDSWAKEISEELKATKNEDQG